MLAATLGGAQAADLKACWVYPGPHNDGGFSEQHDLGRQAVQKEFGDKVDASTYVESVQEGPDSERVIERLARSGCGLIFTTSFGFMDPTLKVAEQFPKVKFEHMSGYKTDPNMATYNLRWYQGRYVQGQIAAKMSKAGLAGYIGSFPIPEVIMGIDAFMLGAQSVNPDFKVKIIWVNTWFDPGKEADAAKTLVDQGVDVLVQHTDSPAAIQVAEQRGIYAFGQSADMGKFGPQGPARLADRRVGVRTTSRKSRRSSTAPGRRMRPGPAWPTATSCSDRWPTCPTTSRRWPRSPSRTSSPASWWSSPAPSASRTARWW